MNNRKLYWIITNSCNLACRYCYYNTGLEKRVREEFDLGKAKMIVKQMPLFFNEVIFTGGETLLFPHIYELIKLCKNERLKVGILTNGVLLNKTNCKKLVNNKVDSISISLDSLNSSMNNYLRGKTKMVIKGIKELIKANKKNRIKIEVSQTITKKNILSLHSMVDFCVKNKIFLWLDPVEVNKNLPYLKDISLDECSTEELQLIKKEMDYWVESMKIKSLKEYTNDCLSLIRGKRPEKISCPMGSTNFVLDIDGTIYPCFLRKDLDLGSIYNDKLKTILRSKKLTNNLLQLQQAKCVSLGCVCLTNS